MRLIIFDVGNAACSIISSPNNYGMMIDCGSHSDKDNPVDLFNANHEWLGTEPFETSEGVSYKLGLLHITHPDDDHVRNAKRIKKDLKPYLLRRRRHEEFPDEDSINKEYVEEIDDHYRGSDPETIDWGFAKNDIYSIPMQSIKQDEELSKKVRNNSSILRLVEYNTIRILFAGDMEKEGWKWLVENRPDFVKEMNIGLNILIAPHHGHKSGFPKELFELTKTIDAVIHSKGSEGNIDGTDVATQYSENAHGVKYTNLNDKKEYIGKVLTTRSNGNIYIRVNIDGYDVWADKASPNHEKVDT